MPAACNKTDLITLCDRDFARLTVLLDHLGPAAALAPDAQGWSLRDVVAHRAHWIHLTLDWVRDVRAGRRPEIPAPGVAWSDMARYDDEVRQAHAGDSWGGVRQALRAAHMELMREIDALDEAALYGAPLSGDDSPWPAGRFLEACGARHYRSAARAAETRLRLEAHPQGRKGVAA